MSRNTAAGAADSRWAALAEHARELGETGLRRLFDEQSDRFERFSLRVGDLLIDWSKTLVTSQTMRLLSSLAEAAGVESRRDAMFAGEAVNSTEGRAVLHAALRNLSGRAMPVGGQDVMPAVRGELDKFLGFAEQIRNRTFVSSTGTPFAEVVNIGIGGSDLGPAMVTAALAPYHDGPGVHFVSNVDGAHIADTLKRLDPEATLFIVASKTFTTLETITNARTARGWIAGALGEGAVGNHFCAVSTATDKVEAFGIRRDRTFGFWDWVGGRTSLWSAIGLPIAIAVGAENFRRLLEGGHAIDEHFRTVPADANAPMILGLLGVWHRNVLGYPTRAILPYDQRLARFPAFLQQLDMESNGKRVTLSGEEVECATGPVVWGEPGTNGQHAFFQFLHQGTDIVPCEFLIAAEGHEPELAGHHQILIANCLAQSQALMRGRSRDEAYGRMLAAGVEEEDARGLAPHRTFPGNRPSITIAYRRLDPDTLGRLIALYEHRVFVEGAIWGINSFDQWGVELGKELASDLLPVLRGDADPQELDGSTKGLVGFLSGQKQHPDSG